ncbi:MAG: septum site-determining protein MinC [Chloroflexi bacterium RBG_13_68_17]|nr:MAG: septum site-determining protein MinC [Chloroflexi bacterium RBG_13_68_17]
MTETITIKGTRDGLLLTVAEGTWEDVYPVLLQAVDAQGDFFRGARLAVQLGGLQIGAAELSGLIRDLANREIHLWAVLSEAENTRKAAADLGLAQELPRSPESEPRPAETGEGEMAGDEALLVHRTLRSGHRIHFHGHVIVLGDVNPGAEIVAGGNVIVWGRLRGTVHAGAAGDEGAIVCALDLSPMQLRIADQIAASPERRGKPKPESVRIHEGQLIAESWGDEHRR